MEPRFEEVDRCAVCGGSGSTLFGGVHDFMCGHPGTFNIMECGECGFCWITPRPDSKSIGEYYRTCVTHQPLAGTAAAAEGRTSRPFSALRDALRNAVMCGYYGYTGHRCTPLCRLGKWLGMLSPLRARATGDMRELLPPNRPGGAILDIGCGRGDLLERFRGLGWRVCGLEPDAVPAGIASERGIRVFNASVEEASLPEGEFDQVMLNHAIEHIYNPSLAFKKCFDCLKPGGRLVLYTPNAASLGRKLFGSYWLPFDPPRHAGLFSPEAMRRALSGAGFGKVSVRTVAYQARLYFDSSSALKAGMRLHGASAPFASGRFLFYAAERAACAAGIGWGEEILAVAVKQPGLG